MNRLADNLAGWPINAVYTSPVERALETAQAICDKRKLTPIIRERLGEVRFGSWEGQTFADLQHDTQWITFNNSRSTVPPPNGESMAEVQARMAREINSIRATITEGTTVALVSHADPIRLLLAYYLGSPIDLLHRFTISLASISALGFVGDSPNVLYVNRTIDD